LRAIRRWRLKRALGSCGKNVTGFVGATFWGPENIYIGNDVRIQPDIFISAINAEVRIGNKVMIAPRVGMITGDHNISVVGSYMYDVHEKQPSDDNPIIVEDDVWIGFGAIILKGVTLGRGSVVAAGAVVTKDVPRHGVVAGVPAKVIHMRFTPREAEEHERLLKAKQQSEATPCSPQTDAEI
jgi:acetyltransferase-like isoleucine patch superfamily enzyme